MSGFNVERRGHFSYVEFEKILEEAKRTLAEEFEVPETSIKMVRNSPNIGISIAGCPTFPAQVVGYEIIKDEKVIGHLEGHLSTSLDYMHIFSSP